MKPDHLIAFKLIKNNRFLLLIEILCPDIIKKPEEVKKNTALFIPTVHCVCLIEVKGKRRKFNVQCASIIWSMTFTLHVTLATLELLYVYPIVFEIYWSIITHHNYVLGLQTRCEQNDILSTIVLHSLNRVRFPPSLFRTSVILFNAFFNFEALSLI